MDEQYNVQAVKSWYLMYENTEATKFLSGIGKPVEELLLEPSEFIASGNKVVALGRQRVRSKSTGRIIEWNWSHIWTVADGNPVGLQEYYDTAAMEAASQGM
jgi:ketosteroid isomerase-like protein